MSLTRSGSLPSSLPSSACNHRSSQKDPPESAGIASSPPALPLLTLRDEPREGGLDGLRDPVLQGLAAPRVPSHRPAPRGFARRGAVPLSVPAAQRSAAQRSAAQRIASWSALGRAGNWSESALPVQDLFDKFDADHSGSIDVKELEASQTVLRDEARRGKVLRVRVRHHKRCAVMCNVIVALQ